MTNDRQELRDAVHRVAAAQYPSLTAGQLRALGDAFLEAFKWEKAGDYEIEGNLLGIVQQRPALLRAVPSAGDVAVHLSKDITDPKQRLDIAREAASLSADERLAALPHYVDVDAPASSSTTRKVKVDPIAALATPEFLKLSATERVTRARRVAADNPSGAFQDHGDGSTSDLAVIREAAVHRAAGRTLSPTMALNEHRAKAALKK